MATKQQLINALKDILTVITQYDTSHCSQDYRDSVKEAKRILETEKPKEISSKKTIKLVSEGGKSLKSACNHYGRKWGSCAGVSMEHAYQSYRKHFTTEPIATFA